MYLMQRVVSDQKPTWSWANLTHKAKKLFPLLGGISTIFYASYLFIPEGKRLNEFTELNDQELKQISLSDIYSTQRFEKRVRIVSTLYHKLKGHPIPQQYHVKPVYRFNKIKLFFPVRGDVAFYPSNTIYFARHSTHNGLGFLAHEIGHLEEQSTWDFISDNLKGCQSKINFQATGVLSIDESPAIFWQFELASIAANYNRDLALHLLNSVNALPQTKTIVEYQVASRTIKKLILEYGSAQEVHSHIKSMDCHENYQNYLNASLLKLTTSEFFEKTFQFFSSYLRDGNTIEVMEPLVDKIFKESEYSYQSKIDFWDSLSQEIQSQTLVQAISDRSRFRFGALTENSLNQLTINEKTFLVVKYHNKNLTEFIDMAKKKAMAKVKSL